jgi:ABC-2 type transport system ATP-binding protein
VSRAGRRTAALRLDALAKRYGDRPALEPLDLRIEPGESVAVVGHNGSGKSTLLALVAGLLEPSSGSVSVFGHDPSSVEARRRRSYLPDHPVLYEDLSLREHLQYVGRLHGVDHDERADEVLGRLGLTDRADELPTTFSRGLRQKAALAVGLARPFDLVVIDEPFVGLDSIGRAGLVDLLAEASSRGATVVAATHDPDLVDTTDRCLTLADGVLVTDGPPPPPVR